MTEIRAQIREEAKKIPKKDLVDYFCELDVKQPFINLPDKADFDRHDLNKLLIETNLCLSQKDKDELEDLKKCYLILESDGLFLCSPEVKDSQHRSEFKKIISENDLWLTQGQNNHIHLNEYTKNPISQMIMAQKLIFYWLKQLLSLNMGEGKAVIYLNGLYDSTVCIYYLRNKDNIILNNYDEHVGMKSCNVTELTYSNINNLNDCWERF